MTTFTREIDHFNSSGVLQKSLTTAGGTTWAVKSARFTLTSEGGCGAGTVVVGLRDHREAGRVGVQYGDEVRFRWSTSDDYVYAGIVHRTTVNAESNTLTIQLRSPMSILNGLFATDAAGEVETVEFGADSSAPAYTNIDDVLTYYLSGVISGSGISTATTDIAPPAQNISRIQWKSTHTVRRVLNDLSTLAGGEREIYRWGIVPGETSGAANRLYFKKLSALTTSVGTVYIGRSYGDDPALGYVIDLNEHEGSDVHNILHLVGGNDDAASDTTYREKFTDAASLAEYPKRATRIVNTAITNTTQGAEWATGYFARYAQPERYYDGLQIKPAESEGIPRPWLGKVQLVDIQAGERKFEEISAVDVEWNEYPIATLHLGRIEHTLNSGASGNVRSPTNAFDRTLQEFDELQAPVAGLAPLTDERWDEHQTRDYEQDDEIEYNSDRTLEIGTVISASTLRSHYQIDEALQFIVHVMNGGDVANLGTISIATSFKPIDGSWETTASYTLTASDRINTYENSEQRVGPVTGPSESREGEYGYRVTVLDDMGATLYRYPDSDDKDEWLSTGVLNRQVNIFPCVWSL